MARAGLLAGLPSEQMAGGNVFDRVGRDVATQAGIEQRQQGLDIAQSQEQRQGEKFSLEKQLHPTALRLAQQQVESNDMKFKETMEGADNRKKVGVMLGEVIAGLKDGTMTADKAALAGINMSYLLKNYQGMAGAMSDYGKIQRGEEEGNAIGELISGEGPLLAGALGNPVDPQAQMAAIRAVNKYPKAWNSGFGKGIVAAATANLSKAMSPAAAEVAKLYLAETVGVTDPAAKKAAWDKLLAQNPDAALYFEQNPKLVPDDIEEGRKVEALKAKEAVVQPGKLELVQKKGEFDIAEREVTGKATVEAAKIGATSREKVQAERGRMALEKITKAGTIKDGALLVQTTTRELIALQSKWSKELDPAIKAGIAREIGEKEDELRVYKDHYSNLVNAAGGAAAGKGAVGEKRTDVQAVTLSRARESLKKVPKENRGGYINELAKKNAISDKERDILLNEIQRGTLR